MRNPIFESLAYNFLIPPFHRWRHDGRWWYMLSLRLEHLPDEPSRRPVTHNDFSTGSADALQFSCDQFGARREHGADQADDDIERTIRIGKHFCIAFIETGI